MLRWLTNILDIKNLLGVQRVTPDPAYPANETVMRFNGTTYAFNTSGDFDIITTVGGVQVTTHHSSVGIFSGTMDEGTDVIVRGSITDLDAGVNCNFIAFANYLTAIRVATSHHTLKTIDLRNAGDVHNFYRYTPPSIPTIYANAQYSDLANFAQGLIDDSTVTDGTLWIDPAQQYASYVITAAQAKGWSVYYL